MAVLALLGLAAATWTLTASRSSETGRTAHAAVSHKPSRKAKGRHGSKPSSPQDAGATATERPFRVMTYNVRAENPKDRARGHGWMDRRADVLQVVLNFLPDIVGFQELTTTRQLPKSEQPDGFMKAHLEPAGYRIVPGTSRSPKNIYYLARRFSEETSSTPHAVYLWPDPQATLCPEAGPPIADKAAMSRTLTWTVLRQKTNGRRVFVANTHLVAHKNHAESRLHEARCIRQIVARLAGDLPVVLFGDFNATIDTPELRALVDPNLAGAATLTDTARRPHESSFNRFCEEHCKPGPRFDYVFARGLRIPEPAQVITLKPGGTWPSDHMPVLATLAFPSAASTDADR